MLQSSCVRPHSALLSLVLLCCFRVLYVIYLSNSFLLSYYSSSSSSSTFLYFTPQNVYLPVPSSLLHYEDCVKRRHVALYRIQIARHIASTCNRARCGNSTCGESEDVARYEDLPETALANMVIDKQRHFLYAAVVGAFGSKWSKLIMAVNQRDGGSDNPVRMSEFIKTNSGRDYLSNTKDMFKFYFVRNPLDRVISGYFYYFVDMEYASQYLNGSALQELAQINKLRPDTITTITFEQYLQWIINGKLSAKHFGLQSDIIQPCSIKYTLNGIFEILALERLFVSHHVPDLSTYKTTFTTIRDLVYLRREALRLTRAVKPKVMEAFYRKYDVDYQTWNYSKPGQWFYPYPEIVKTMRVPGEKDDFPKLKDLTEEDLLMLEELKGEEIRGGEVRGGERG